MAGITAYGVYVPIHRLSRAEIARAWGTAPPPGEKAVASPDEDSLTMAVAAARNCLAGIDPKDIDGLYFASTTSPYREKQAAATIAAVLGLKQGAFTMDIGGSLRGGTNAMKAAVNAVSSGSLNKVLVCAADCRLPMPNGANEMAFGDGAAAVLIGNTGVAATVDATYTMFDEIVDVWRSDKDQFVHSWESRFVREEGYLRVIPEAISAALKKHNLTAKDISKAALYAPDSRQLSATARKLGFDMATQVQDSLYSQMGDTGTALPLMLLAAALEDARAGDRILLASYGNGADVVILTVTADNATARPRRSLQDYLSAKLMIPSYQKYLRWRGLVEIEPPATPALEQPSPVALWRDNYGGLRLHGVKCKKCGTVQYPKQRVCMVCGAKDDFEDYSFADRTGTVATFSHDNLGISADPPNTIVAVDFPEGGRITCDMTDRDPQEVKIGMPVEMTFRELRYVGGFYTYWWKCRPLREAQTNQD
ncbi:MAG: OB-fold domain-containing protein [Chloroflexota bacterium]|nr:OB-fold domain-containing protein [Chloroflexota bacterium]